MPTWGEGSSALQGREFRSDLSSYVRKREEPIARRRNAAEFLSFVLGGRAGAGLYRRISDNVPGRAGIQTPTSGPGHVRGRSLRSIS